MSTFAARGNLLAWICMLIATGTRLIFEIGTGLAMWSQIAAVVVAMLGIVFSVSTLRDATARDRIQKELRRAHYMSMRGR